MPPGPGEGGPIAPAGAGGGIMGGLGGIGGAPPAIGGGIGGAPAAIGSLDPPPPGATITLTLVLPDLWWPFTWPPRARATSVRPSGVFFPSTS